MRGSGCQWERRSPQIKALKAQSQGGSQKSGCKETPGRVNQKPAAKLEVPEAALRVRALEGHVFSDGSQLDPILV